MTQPDVTQPDVTRPDVTRSDDLGPRPEPTAEEPELHPGGVDSAEDPRYGTTFDDPTTPDLSPDDNPAIEDVVPDEVTAPDDKPQAPAESDREEIASPSDAADEADEDAGETSEPTA